MKTVDDYTFRVVKQALTVKPSIEPDDIDQTTALKLAVKKWQVLSEAIKSRDYIGGFGTYTCPLCVLYWDDGCYKCPVYAASEKQSCYDTPFELADIEMTPHNFAKELEFLTVLQEKGVDAAADWLKKWREELE